MQLLGKSTIKHEHTQLLKISSQTGAAEPSSKSSKPNNKTKTVPKISLVTNDMNILTRASTGKQMNLGSNIEA
jgi:hypothetical protein